MIHVEEKRGRIRSKLTWDEVVRKDLILLHFLESMVLKKAEWRKRIHAAKPNWFGFKAELSICYIYILYILNLYI